jgi:hypothetical protein
VAGLDIFALPSTKEAKKKKDAAKAGTPPKTTGTQPTESATNATVGIPIGQTGSGNTLSGLPKGTQIKGAGTATYEKGAGALKFANLSLDERATLLLRMGQIPGLYGTGLAPTPDFISKQIKSGSIVPRDVDFQALEKIAAISDWSGDTTDNTIVKLSSNRGMAEQFFGKVTPAVKAVTSYSAIEADLNSKFLDLFESKADTGLIKAYAKEVNALESSKSGITAQQKEDILLKYVQKKANDLYNLNQTGMAPGTTDKGALGRYVRSIRTAYDSNGIPINEKQIYSKAVESLRSQDAYKNVLDGVTMQATAILPAFKDFFAQGKTAREVLSPWINLRSQILEIPEDQIKIQDMYNVGSGDKAMSINDYKKMLYASEEFKKTNAFKSRSTNDLQTLLRAFNIGGRG